MKKHRLGLGAGESASKKKLINELVGHTYHQKVDPLLKFVKRRRGGVIPTLGKLSPRRGGEMMAIKMVAKPKKSMGAKDLLSMAMKDMTSIMGSRKGSRKGLYNGGPARMTPEMLSQLAPFLGGKRQGLYGGGLANMMPNMAQSMMPNQMQNMLSPAFPTAGGPLGSGFNMRKKGGKVCKTAPSRSKKRERHSWGDVIGNTLGGGAAGALSGSVIPGLGTGIGALGGALGSFIPGALSELFHWKKGGPVRVKRAMGGVGKMRLKQSR